MDELVKHVIEFRALLRHFRQAANPTFE